MSALKWNKRQDSRHIIQFNDDINNFPQWFIWLERQCYLTLDKFLWFIWILTYSKSSIVGWSVWCDSGYEDAVIVTDVRCGASSSSYAEPEPAGSARYTDLDTSLVVHYPRFALCSLRNRFTCKIKTMSSLIIWHIPHLPYKTLNNLGVLLSVHRCYWYYSL